MTINQTTQENGQLVITREIQAPRELVFKVWTEAEHLKHWWGPRGFELTVAHLEVRPGGHFHYKMSSAEGQVMWGRFEYREVKAPERIVFINAFSNEAGDVVRSPFSEIYPLEILNTLTLTEMEGRTLLTLRGGPLQATEEERAFYEGMFESMKMGFGGTFDQLERYLKEALV
jgi:uncharacterized protein YndB with AHSA1/START domain